MGEANGSLARKLRRYIKSKHIRPIRWKYSDPSLDVDSARIVLTGGNRARSA